MQTVGLTVNGTAVNHSGYTVDMDIRDPANSDVRLFHLTTGNGRIIVSGTAITLSVAATATQTMPFEQGDYDLKVTSPSGVVDFYLRGKVRVLQTVSR